MRTFTTKTRQSFYPRIPHPEKIAAWRPQHPKVQQILRRSWSQEKLKIGAPNDRYEQEANHVADQVMRMPEPQVQRQVSPEEEDEELLQRAPSGNAAMAPSVVVSEFSSPGQPLDQGTRSLMEGRFGQDFSQVRVHTSGQSARSATAVGARAYTVGRDVVFGQGEYAPGTGTGNRLLAHELTHVVQQGSVAPRQAEPGRGDAAVPATNATDPKVQRAMKFELQTFNPIWRTKGKSNKGPEKLPRKFGPQDFLHKATRASDVKRKAAGKEGKGMELQSETGGFAEFETPTWSRSLFGFKKGLKATGVLQTIQEGVEMTDAINAAPTAASGRKKFPFSVSHLRRSGSLTNRLRPGEELEVEIVDSAWHAAIQSSESIDLTQYESLLREHESAGTVKKTVDGADKLVLDASIAESIPLARLTRLRSFLQIIVNYITSGQSVDLAGHPSKAGFLLMSRTSFSSMYRDILETDEKKAFRNLVSSNKILAALGLTRSDRFFIKGHGSKKNNKGVTVHRFLESIYASRLRSKRDYMSPPREDDLSIAGSAAMGRFDVEKKIGEKDTGLIKIETRATNKKFSDPNVVPVERKDVFPGSTGKFNVRVQPAKKWVAYAFELFTFAAVNRQRPDVPDDPATVKDETRKTGLKF